MGMSKDFRLLLIRAGRTSWDEEHRLSGGADLPLTAEAVASVRASIADLGEPGPRVLLHAPDEASTQTASILSRGLGIRARRQAGLAEPGLGLWQGLMGADLELRCPSVYRQWLHDPASVSPPQGEPLAQASERIIAELSRAMRRVRQDHPSVGVVVRPMARGLVRCWLGKRSLSSLWEEANAGRDCEWHMIEGDRLSVMAPSGGVRTLERVRT